MKIAIVGGGAGGLFLASLLPGATVFEGKDRVGKKLLVTGNGRCNLSNQDMDLGHFHGNKDLIRAVFQRAGQDQVLDHFSLLGLDTLADHRQRIYPRTLQASSLVNILRRRVQENNQVFCQREILAIRPEKEGFILRDQEGQEEFFHRVILATGGRAMPKSGSRGQGYKLAQSLGHTVTPTFPAIIQVKTQDPFLNHLQGVKIEGLLEVHLDGKKLAQESGEILITNYGLSGPPVLDLSRRANLAFREGKKVSFHFSLLNGSQDLDQVYTYVQERTYQYYHLSLEEFLEGLVHKKFIHVLAKSLDLSKEIPLQDLAYQDLERFWRLLAHYQMDMTGTMGYDQAQVTCGGVSGLEVDETCQSKIHPGLYMIGELLDVDGDCGGYNLQWAWSSAMACAQGILQEERQKRP